MNYNSTDFSPRKNSNMYKLQKLFLSHVNITTTKKNADFFLEILDGLLISSAIFGNLYQFSVVFGNLEIIGNCWKMAKNSVIY